MSNEKIEKWHIAYHPQECFYSIHSMPSHPQDCGSNVFDEKHVGKELAIKHAKLAASAPELLESLKTLIEKFDYKKQSIYSFAMNDIDRAKALVESVS